MREVILVHVVIVKVHAAIKVLWQEVKPHIIPMSWLQLIKGELFMTPVDWEWLWQMSRLKDGHLPFKVLILASVIESISIAHTDACCHHYCLCLV
jgi:hypothetical protein